jgi:3-hydroxy-9,10-secoandrosta-1,3,5(10)-triene-9,17-dione monooxygenase
MSPNTAVIEKPWSSARSGRPDARQAARLTAAEAIERARALRPVLAGRAAEAESLRHCPPQSVRDLFDSGLMRMMQPIPFGGSDLRVDVLAECSLEMAKSCASTAWVFLNLASHSWNIGQFPLQAQHEVWDDDPEALVATGLALPCGQAKPVEGGYLVSGRWPFGSGVDAATWMWVGAMTRMPDGPPEKRFFLVPQPAFRSLDNWQASGLRGTGSHDVEVGEVFVPAHRSVLADLFATSTELPGAALYESANYRLPGFATFGFLLASAPIGAAAGAVEWFAESIRRRSGTYTGARLAEVSTVQMRLAEASVITDMVLVTYRKNLSDLVAAAEAGETPSIETRLRWKRDLAYQVRECARALDVLMPALGAGGLSMTHPVQRACRDVHAAASHIALTWDMQAGAYAQQRLGVPLPAGMIF